MNTSLPTKIMIDCRFAAKQVGLGRYTRNTVLALLSTYPTTSFILLVADADTTWFGSFSNVTCVYMKAAHYTVSEQIELRKIIRAHLPDIYFAPHFNIPLCTTVPIVCTIHDLILHKYASQASFIKRWLYRFFMYIAIKRANHIIAVSHFTKQQLLLHYPALPEARITVCTEVIESYFMPASATTVSAVLAEMHINHPFLLYVGNNKPHKNVPFLLDAFIQADLPNVDLVLICSDPELQVVYPQKNIHFLSSINDATLVALYTASIGFVSGSLYEGFCLPILEARACGRPSLIVSGSAGEELADNSTIVVPPHLSEFIDGLRRLVHYTESVTYVPYSEKLLANDIMRVFEHTLSVTL